MMKKAIYMMAAILALTVGKESLMNTRALEKLAQTTHTVQDLDGIANRANEAIRLVAPFIKKHEGFSQNAYWDKAGKKYTLGHGHTFIPDSNTGKLRAVTKDDTMDDTASSALLMERLRSNAASMYRNLPWTHSLSPGALAALYDIAYNAGPGVFSAANSPRLTSMMNAPGADRDAIVFVEVPTYRKAGGKVRKGLVNRRADVLKAFRQPKVPKIGT
jgi:GH24 family phage-related lysozyme (muramidase)